MRLRDFINIVEQQEQDEIEEGMRDAMKGMAIGAAAFMSANADAATGSKVDPDVVAASGDTRRTRPVAKAPSGKPSPKKRVDAKAAAAKFHLNLD